MTGSGTELDPYIIADVNDLQAMNSHLNSWYELGCDIDASATSGWNGGSGFLPIGSSSSFGGHFDGKHHSITNLYINRPTAFWGGLFGAAYIYSHSEIRDVTLIDVDITTGHTDQLQSHLGALIGLAYEFDVINCHVSGIITLVSIDVNAFVGGLVGSFYNGKLNGCSSTVEVHGIHCVGGLVGYLGWVGGTYTNCKNSYSTGDVYVTGTASLNWQVGGFVGYNWSGTISECFALGNVDAPLDALSVYKVQTGGFVGWLEDGEIEDCYSKGNVSGMVAGGFVSGVESFNTIGIVVNCYSTGTVTGKEGEDIGGFCATLLVDSVISNCFWDTETSGMGTSDGGTGKTTVQMQTKSTFTDAGWNFDPIWGIYTHCNDGYPCLTYTTPLCSTSTVGGDYSVLVPRLPVRIRAKRKGSIIQPLDKTIATMVTFHADTEKFSFGKQRQVTIKRKGT